MKRKTRCCFVHVLFALPLILMSCPPHPPVDAHATPSCDSFAPGPVVRQTHPSCCCTLASASSMALTTCTQFHFNPHTHTAACAYSRYTIISQLSYLYTNTQAGIVLHDVPFFHPQCKQTLSLLKSPVISIPPVPSYQIAARVLSSAS